MNAISLLHILNNSRKISFVKEIIDSINSNGVIIYSVISLPRLHILNIYGKRARISEEKNENGIEGYDELLNAVTYSNEEYIDIINVVTPSIGYFVFFYKASVLSVLKIKNQNIRKAMEFSNNRDIKDSENNGTYYFQGKPN